MNTILTISQQDFLTEVPLPDTTGFRKRKAARAVLLDPTGQVYLLNVSVHGYHKLPGGGVNDGEEIENALMRELQEEVGCHAEIVAELGQIVEYRTYDDGGLEQVSYCYLTKQVGEQGAASLEEGEIAEGMLEVKAANLDEAIALLYQDAPNNLEGEFIKKRDLAILQTAKELLTRKSQIPT